MIDDLGREIEDRVYNQRDMVTGCWCSTNAPGGVAEKTVEYLSGTDPYGKTIVFCETIDHAERMRSALVNEVAMRLPAEAGNTSKCVVRITGDNDEGKRGARRLHPSRTALPIHRHHVEAVDDRRGCQDLQAHRAGPAHRVDDRVQADSWGAATRIHEDAGQALVHHHGLQKATELFADPAFDGEPVVVYEPGGGEPPVPPDDETGEGGDDEDLTGDPDPPPGGTTRYVISGVPGMVVAERVQYYGNDGRLITESLTEYTREAVREKYATLADFLRRWTGSDRKAAVVDEPPRARGSVRGG